MGKMPHKPEDKSLYAQNKGKAVQACQIICNPNVCEADWTPWRNLACQTMQNGELWAQ